MAGCPDLWVATDHKPLLGLFEKEIGKIENPRLRALIEKTLQFSFTVTHLPGVDNGGADATSRNPVGIDCVEIDAIQFTGKSFLQSSYSELCGMDILEIEEIEWKTVELASIDKQQVDDTGVVDWEE